MKALLGQGSGGGRGSLVWALPAGGSDTSVFPCVTEYELRMRLPCAAQEKHSGSRRFWDSALKKGRGSSAAVQLLRGFQVCCNHGQEHVECSTFLTMGIIF